MAERKPDSFEKFCKIVKELPGLTKGPAVDLIVSCYNVALDEDVLIDGC